MYHCHNSKASISLGSCETRSFSEEIRRYNNSQSIGLYADLRSNVNNLQSSLSRVDKLQQETDEIQDTIDEIVDNLEQINTETSIVRDSLALYMILDQLHHKIN